MSAPEDLLALQIRAAKLPAPEREYKFHPVRKWRLDFAWPAKLWACEVEGGHWTGGRHVRGAGFEKDAEKYAHAALQGFRLLRVTSAMVKDGRALAWLSEALA